MSIEIVSIGSELLTGETLNTNVSCISKHLVKEGWKVERQTTLPDNLVSLKRGLEECLERAHVVIATGGLGPTLDDITQQVAQEIFQIEPTIIDNPVGSAPGFFYEKEKILILLPGVPIEMEKMLEKSVLDILRKKLSLPHKPFQEELHFFGLSENQIDPLLRKLQQLDSGMSLGIYPGYGILTVRLTSPHKSCLNEAKLKLLESFKENVFFAKSGTLQEALQTVFVTKGHTLAIAESCTGGLLSSYITSQPGASQYFLGSVIVYSNILKEKLLDVSSQTLLTEGAVSKKTVEEMLSGLLNKTGADFGIAVSGIAGPTGGSVEKPVGTIFYALGQREKEMISGSFCAPGNRQTIMLYTTNLLLGKLLKYSRQ